MRIMATANGMPLRRMRGWVLAAALLAALPGWGASGPLEEIVVQGRLDRYSALKSDTPILETARSVSIEGQLQLLDKGALNLADAYVYSAGVTGETYGFATRGDWLKVRGLNVPEYRDSLQALFSNYNNTRPDIYTIEQVEILKGPASVLYGQGSPGGLVNVVSKRPRPDAHRELVVDGGNFGRAQIAADLTGALDGEGRWLYRLIGVYRDTDTQIDRVAERARVVAPSLTWRPSERTNITLLGSVQATDSDTAAQFLPVYGTLLPAPDGRRIDPDVYLGEPGFNRYDTRTRSVTVLADHQLSAVWSIEATARWTDGEADYRQAWPAFIGGDRYAVAPDGSLYGDGTVPRTFYVSDANSNQRAADVRWRADFVTGPLQHEVLMGVQYQEVATENDRSYAYALGYDFATGGPDAALGDTYWINVFEPRYGRVPPDEVLDAFFVDAPEAVTRDRGVYVSDQVSVGRWRLTLGLRADDVRTDTGTVTQDDDAVSASAGALYRFGNGLALYGSYAESFQPVVGRDALTGDAFDPQRGEQWEAGIKYQPPGRQAVVTVAWFDIEQSNLPNPNSLVDAPSQQEGVSTIRGVELEALAWLGDFQVELNASRVDTDNPSGFRLASVPEDQASLWVSYRPGGRWQGFRTGVGLRHVGESWDGVDALRTPAYTLGDLMVGYGRGPWDLALNVRNVTDKDHLATCLSRGDCFVGEARTVVGRASYRF
jgi:iron complex outermembrane receptor protein